VIEVPKVADPVPVVEAEAPKTPAKAPQTPGKKQPQLKTPVKLADPAPAPAPVIEAEAPKTPAKAPQTPGKKQPQTPAPKTPAKVIEVAKVHEPKEPREDEDNKEMTDDSDDDAPESVSVESAKQSIVDSRRAQFNQINKLKEKKKEMLRNRQEKDIERKKNLLPTNILNAIASLPQDNGDDSESDEEPTKPQNTRQTFSDDEEDDDDDLFGDPYALVSSDEEGNTVMKSSGTQIHGQSKGSGKTTTSLLKVKNQAGINVAFLKANTKNSALLPTSQLNPASAGESYRSSEFIKTFKNPLSAQRTKFRPTQQGSSRKSKTNTTKSSAKLGVFSKSSFSTF